MSRTQRINEGSLVTLRLQPVVDLTEEQFYQLCQLNRELRIERLAEGDLIIMTLAGGETSWRNSRLITALTNWADRDEIGVVFDSSGGFTLPNGAIRAPNAAWVKRSRLINLTPDQKKKFLPLCPDFVIELRSPTDRLEDVQDKMREYMDNGAQLGWLIDPENRRVIVYQPNRPVEWWEYPAPHISGEPFLPGFVLDLRAIWQPPF
jgi:Uma2 family endonuclease